MYQHFTLTANGALPWVTRRETIAPLLGWREPVWIFQSMFPWLANHCEYTRVDFDTLESTLRSMFDVLGDMASGDVIFDNETIPTWWPLAIVRGGRLVANEPALGRWVRLIREMKARFKGEGKRWAIWSGVPYAAPWHFWSHGIRWRDYCWRVSRDMAPLGRVLDFTTPHVYLCSEKHRMHLTVEQACEYIRQLVATSRTFYDTPCLPCLWHQKYDVWQEQGHDNEFDSRELQLARQWEGDYFKPQIEQCVELDGVGFWDQAFYRPPSKSAASSTPDYVADGIHDRPTNLAEPGEVAEWEKITRGENETKQAITAPDASSYPVWHPEDSYWQAIMEALRRPARRSEPVVATCLSKWNEIR